jgi:AcrR family transcriptional regulator
MGRIPVDKPRIQNHKKQKEIADALFSTFMEKGIHSLSTEMLCEVSGKSKATLYKYFESKKEIIQFILEERLSEIIKFGEILGNENIDHKTRYRNAVSMTIKAIEGITPIFLSELSSIYPDLFTSIIDLKKMSLNLLKNFYEDGVEKMVFVDLSPELLVLNDSLFFTAILESDFLTTQSNDLKTLFEGYFKIRFNGILK